MTTPDSRTAVGDEHGGRSATPLVVAMIIVALGVVVYYALGMPGMDHSAASSNHTPASHASHRAVDRPTFDAIVADAATVTINVHVPAIEIDLDGTDLAMPFNDLEVARLPSDRSTALAVYCRSGAMSAVAVRRLLDLGYTNVVELDGGTEGSSPARSS